MDDSDLTTGQTMPMDETPTCADDIAPRQPLAIREIGPYRLLHRLGEGGMGEVWEAEQTQPLRRRVAIKLILGGAGSQQVVARFSAERQAQALMSHPTIARIFDAGETSDGEPYFVMELVRGLPINEHADRRRLTTAQRIELFIQVCEGVQHAHHKAIIHRDLKPTNILVTEHDGRALPKIIDFGIAKATAQPLTEDVLVTAVGTIAGTPEYMSPEQADLGVEDIDTRSDVYSLGVVLYELLVGALPFDSERLRSGGLLGLRKILKEEPSPKPSTKVSMLDQLDELAQRRGTEAGQLSRQLRGDLDWIVIKALEKERDRRYGSPAELAADLERHLNDQPVLAGPPSPVYRLGKLMRRHKVVFSATGVVALALVLGVVGTTVGLLRARDEARAAERVSSFLADMLADVDPHRAGQSLMADLEAQVRSRAAREGADDVETAAAVEAFRAAIGDLSGTDAALNILDEEILARAGSAVVDRFADDPLVAGRLHHTLGAAYQSLGLYDRARPQVERAVDLQSDHLGAGHAETLSTKRLLGWQLHQEGRFEEAELIFVETLDEQRQSLGEDHPDTLRTEADLAWQLLQTGHYDEAERQLLETLGRQRRVLGQDHPSRLRALSHLGRLYRYSGRKEEAEGVFREVLEGREAIEGTDSALTLQAQHDLASLYNSLGRPQEALPLATATLSARQRVLGADHPHTLVSSSTLAEVLLQLGRLDEAEILLLDTVDRRTRVLGPDHPETIRALDSLGGLYFEREDWQRAEPLYLDVVAKAVQALGADHPNVFYPMLSLAEIYSELGRLDEAESWARDSLEGRQRVLGEDHPLTVVSRDRLQMIMGLAQE